MEKYIDSQKYSKILTDLISDSENHNNYQKGYVQGLATANGILLDDNQTPAANVVKVVRCKDCKHFCKDLTDRENHWCFKGVKSAFAIKKVKLDDFCSYGERKTAEK